MIVAMLLAILSVLLLVPIRPQNRLINLIILSGIALYHFSAPILFFNNIFENLWRDYSVTQAWQVVYITSVALAAWGCGALAATPIKAAGHNGSARFRLSARILATSVLPLCLVGLLLAIISGASDKQDLQVQGPSVSQISVYWLIFFALLIVDEGIQQKKRQAVTLIIFGVGVLFLAYLLFLGQRGPLMRFVLSLFVLSFISGIRFKPTTLAILGIVLLSAPTYLQFVKGLLLFDEVDVGSMFGLLDLIGIDNTVKNIVLLQFFGTEFRTGGQNLFIAIANFPSNYEYLGVTQLSSNLSRAMLPGFLFDPFFQTSLIWFNAEFYPDLVARGGGAGMSLVAEGYMAGGIPGVLGYFFCFGLLFNAILNLSSFSRLGRVTVSMLVPIVIFAMRADTTNLFSQSFKFVVVPVLITLCLHEIFRVRKNS